EVAVTGVRHDSREIEPGDLFAARKGTRDDGFRHLGQAVARGAAAVMAEEKTALGVPLVVVRDVQHALADASALVYGDPTGALDVVGITGTNGKTTTAHLVAAALRKAGKRPGVIGTIGYQFEDVVAPATHTTPEADAIARIAAAMRERGASHLVMEISSHAIALGRVAAVRFRVAAFTNLTQDHLDFHGDMASYGEAKAKLFTELSPAAAVINVDDPFGRALAGRAKAPVLRVSSEKGGDADIAPIAIESDVGRTRATLRTPAQPVVIDAPLLGAHNLSNMIVALGICSALGVDLAVAASAFSDVAVPGRLERCDEAEDDVVVVVDYAHTPDALERALTTLRELAGARRLVCIFGCGGDRDPQKRAPMGRAVARLADVAVVTNDNPRSESPKVIADAVLGGLGTARAVVVELDRARAIADTIRGVQSGDVILIAGKGHETYQIIGDQKTPFDDRQHARLALAARRKAHAGDA
ncbi:MAG TPA: UDP-N-acetylmuramoyl-L-alanyl-D-glutamate--2,6-diaminopimelate ligase, partial [Polyangiaceae bacterium]